MTRYSLSVWKCNRLYLTLLQEASVSSHIFCFTYILFLSIIKLIWTEGINRCNRQWFTVKEIWENEHKRKFTNASVTEVKEEMAYLLKCRGNLKFGKGEALRLILNHFPYLDIQCRVTDCIFCMVSVLHKVVPLL